MPEHASCYQAVRQRDHRFDGRFYTAVLTTGIFCRPSCPARTPAAANVQFYPHPAAATEAGFRPCRRCRPELAPGHQEWNRRGDLTGKALKLIDDGVVERDGVNGMAASLGVSERHLLRELTATLGTGPLQLALARRLALARVLLDQTHLTITDIAFASGFGSVRQFNDSFRKTYHTAPSELRQRPARRRSGARGLSNTASARDQTSKPGADGESTTLVVSVRLPSRGPLRWATISEFLAARAIPGLERPEEDGFVRNWGQGWVKLAGLDDDDGLEVTCSLGSVSELADVLQTARTVTDLDTDIEQIEADLGQHRLLAQRLANYSLPRLPGAFDRFEIVMRAVVCQQISVAAARTHLGRLVALACDPSSDSESSAGSVDTKIDSSPTRRFGHFPTPAQVADAPLDKLGMPQRRRETIRVLAEAMANGSIVIRPDTNPDELRQRLVELPGIGPWTAGYIAMRALPDPDGWPVADLVLRRSLQVSASEMNELANSWRPWRAYAALLIWRSKIQESSR